MDEVIYIYLIKNKSNKKKYIGQTINFEKRMTEHIYGRNSKQNSMIDRAIKKHGKECFDFSVIDKTTSQKKADDLERDYIQKYKCLRPAGYNVLIGGRSQQGSWNSRKVYMYDLEGNYIREFDSTQQVQRWSNSFYLYSQVRDCCNGKVKRCKDRMFAYDYHKNIKVYVKPESSKCKKVYQFDKNGSLMYSFKSISEASHITNTSRTSILECLKGNYKTANGYIWSYNNSFPNICLVVQRIQVIQMDENYKFIAEYPSCAEAARCLKLSNKAYKTIWSVLDKKKKRFGYYWFRK